MVVIAIIGILASLAIPIYTNYSNKTKFAELIQATAPLKLAVELCANEQGELIACGNGKNGVPNAFVATSSDKGYVASIHVADNGTITATSQRIKIDEQNKFTYILMPKLQANGQVIWEQSGSCKAVQLC
jgi:type IV pilus assembly protein PilA